MLCILIIAVTCEEQLPGKSAWKAKLGLVD